MNSKKPYSDETSRGSTGGGNSASPKFGKKKRFMADSYVKIFAQFSRNSWTFAKFASVPNSIPINDSNDLPQFPINVER